MPLWLQAGLWGLVGGSALVLGAALGYFINIPQRLVAAVMAFGAGVLISALAFELMDEAYRRGGFDSTALGFISGATVYTAANWWLAVQGAKHHKRSGDQLTDTMIPEAFERAHNFAGLITVFGFLIAFMLSKLSQAG